MVSSLGRRIHFKDHCYFFVNSNFIALRLTADQQSNLLEALVELALKETPEALQCVEELAPHRAPEERTHTLSPWFVEWVVAHVVVGGGSGPP